MGIAISWAEPLQLILVEPKTVTPAQISEWKKDGYKGVAVVLDEDTGDADYRGLCW